MILDAIVQQVHTNSLLVREMDSNNEYLVNVSNARRFSRGDCVRITHTGQMTLSIPPQIIATSVQPIRCNPVRPPSPPRPPFPSRPPSPPPSRPSEMTAIILQRQRNGLLVRDIGNNRQIFVQTPHSDHFCRGQRIVVAYDTMRMNNPPEVNAIDIRTIC